MDQAVLNSYQSGPDEDGRFGIHGGRFVAETLMPLFCLLSQLIEKHKTDPEFERQLRYYQTHYIGRPSPFILQSVDRLFWGRQAVFQA